MDNKKLINCVFENRCLWDVNEMNHHNRDFARQKWENIAQELNSTSEAVKNRWRGLRDTYRKELKKIKRSANDRGKTRASTWSYFNNMVFLKDQSRKNRRENSQTDCEGSEEDDARPASNDDSHIAVASRAINASALIEEVKKRPCLYDTRGIHGNQEVKVTAWNEIGDAVFNDWSKYSLEEKETLVKDMQTKWKSIRDSFSRQLRILDQVKAGQIAEPTKKYVYMDQLGFLTGFIQKRDKNQVSVEDSNDSISATDDHKPLCSISSVDTVQVNAQSVQFVPIQPKPTNFATTTISAIDLNALNVESIEPPLKKMARSLEELVTIQKGEKIDDPMGNRKFLLSLLPFMRNLPDDVNLEVRLQLMSVLQTYTSGK